MPIITVDKNIFLNDSQVNEENLALFSLMFSDDNISPSYMYSTLREKLITGNAIVKLNVETIEDYNTFGESMYAVEAIRKENILSWTKKNPAETHKLFCKDCGKLGFIKAYVSVSNGGKYINSLCSDCEQVSNCKISNMLKTNYYHTTSSDDLNGVEVSAAIKNIFSMAVGAAKGLCSNNVSDEIREKNYLNTASALIKQSIHEMEIFVEHLNGKKETVKGLAGLGDLYVSSGGGRNAKMGFYIGEGLTFSEAKKTKMQKVTVEGADLAIEIAKKVNEDFDEKKLPLMLAMINSITKEKKLELNWELFR